MKPRILVSVIRRCQGQGEISRCSGQSRCHSFRKRFISLPGTIHWLFGPTFFPSSLPSRQYAFTVSGVTSSSTAASRAEYSFLESTFFEFLDAIFPFVCTSMCAYQDGWRPMGNHLKRQVTILTRLKSSSGERIRRCHPSRSIEESTGHVHRERRQGPDHGGYGRGRHVSRFRLVGMVLRRVC